MCQLCNQRRFRTLESFYQHARAKHCVDMDPIIAPTPSQNNFVSSTGGTAECAASDITAATAGTNCGVSGRTGEVGAHVPTRSQRHRHRGAPNSPYRRRGQTAV
eukprot:GFYU01008058.1.p1 GENE.GFYU01008058.1~~GFYU01008058.1.p1  ORF type:complete len:104 (-),score=7.34 GFYU01008058.1:19-330(-)